MPLDTSRHALIAWLSSVGCPVRPTARFDVGDICEVIGAACGGSIGFLAGPLAV